MAAVMQKAALGNSVEKLSLRPSRGGRASSVRPVASGGGKVDMKKQGLNKVAEGAVKQNLMGRSRVMKTKGWTDPQGRRGKGLGVYRFEDKYGANVDGYSPIYTPDQWASSGDNYQLGGKGLAAWLALVGVFLVIGFTLIINTSQLGA